MSVKRKTIAFFPEASFGAALNCVGIAQALRDRGHEAVFLCDPGFAGVFENYGFAEHPVPMAPDMSDKELEQFWTAFITRHLPHFRLSPEEQVPTYVRDCWQAIVESAEIAEAPLRDALAAIGPDAIVVDNVIGFPAVLRSEVPWVRMVSCAETEIADARVPPVMSGLGPGDSAVFERFRERYRDALAPVHDRYNAFRESRGLGRLPPGEFLEASPVLNLLLYAEPLRFDRATPLAPPLYQYLEGCVRSEDPFEMPDIPAGNDTPIVYVSFGSLGAADVALFERMIRLCADLPYRFLVNVGGYKDSFRDVPDNVHLDYWYPQPSVVAEADLVIHHGGNNSVHEALYFGKPSIVMPYCWDGHDNARRLHETGLGRHLDRYAWRDHELIDVLRELTSDAALAGRLERISGQMKAADGQGRAAMLILGAIEQSRPAEARLGAY